MTARTKTRASLRSVPTGRLQSIDGDADRRPRSLPPTPPASIDERDSYASTALGDVIDRSLRASVSRYTAGLSPSALTQAYMDWAMHLAASPGKRLQLIDKAMRKSRRLMHHLGLCAVHGSTKPPCIEPLLQDRRFSDPAWQAWPFNVVHQSFLLQQQWWHVATTGVRGVTEQHEHVVNFASRQILDVFAPSNFLATNPVLLERTLQMGGTNLIRSAQNLLEDLEHARRVFAQALP